MLTGHRDLEYSEFGMNNLPQQPIPPGQPRSVNLILIASGVVVLILLLALFALNYGVLLAFFTPKTKIKPTPTPSSFSELLSQKPELGLPFDLSNPNITGISITYRTVIEHINADTPEGTVVLTSADGEGVPKFIIAPDTEFFFQPKGSDQRSPAAISDLDSAEEVVISVRFDPLSKTTFVRRVTILEEPKTEVSPP